MDDPSPGPSSTASDTEHDDASVQTPSTTASITISSPATSPLSPLAASQEGQDDIHKEEKMEIDHGRALSVIESVGSFEGEGDSDYEGDDSMERVTDAELSYDVSRPLPYKARVNAD